MWVKSESEYMRSPEYVKSPVKAKQDISLESRSLKYSEYVEVGLEDIDLQFKEPIN